MKNANEIKHSLTAVKQTRQITNAMYLLSVTQMKRYIGNVNYTVEYMQRLRRLKRALLFYSHGISHPFKSSYSTSGRTAFIIISAEKGMCGSYNSEIAKLAEKKIHEAKDPYVIIKGSYVEEALAAKGIKANEIWEYPGNAPSIDYASDIADRLINYYLSDEIDEVDIIYTKFLSQTKQRTTCYRLLPLAEDNYDEITEPPSDRGEFEFLGDESEVFQSFTIHFIKGLVYSAMYQSFICENISRMNALRTATNNADEMIEDLNRKYNTIRQLAITSEITEITSAAKCQSETDSFGEEDTI